MHGMCKGLPEGSAVREKKDRLGEAGNMKIFIVEDEENIVRLLKDELMQWGYTVESVKDFQRVSNEVEEENPELILMDISLPCYNGFYWTEKIRKFSHVPILFLSSHSESMDMVQAMQFGADDYIVKPIDLYVTRAKIQALLRRTYEYTAVQDNLSFQGLQLDLAKAALLGQGFHIDLTKTELLILECLFLAKGGISKREEIMNHCWQGEDFLDDNTLSVNITRLRKKLSAVGLEDFIQTKKGIGYFLALKNE